MPPVKNIEHSELLKLLEYNPISGIFIWKRVLTNAIKIGDIAGHLHKASGYIQIRIATKIYRAHRLAWFYMHKEWPEENLDHINHERSDNRMENLRLVSMQCNMQNASLSKASTSGFTGVHLRKDTSKWCAHITLDGKFKSLGSFGSKEEAVLVRKTANLKYGFHENHGTR